MTSKTVHAQLKRVVSNYLGPEEQQLVDRAYHFAQNAHLGTRRESGEPYFNHPVAVALTLARMELDAATIAAALLHDVCEDCSISNNEIKKEFSEEIADLVDGVTKLSKIKIKPSASLLPTFWAKQKQERFSFHRHVESLRKMLLAMTNDIRVILIKLADRLHNMQTLGGARIDKQARIAQETLEIYAPLAYRLGMGDFKGQLEDLAFPFVYPKEYQELHRLVGGKINQREKYVKQFIDVLSDCFRQEKVAVLDIHGRVKHLYSLWQKLIRNDSDLGKIYDLIAIRIIVPTIADCYQVLGLIHSHWNPLLGRIKDYIATPKPNGYQSLHTTIFGLGGEITEIQIRTQEMHEQAERGIAAHWHYAESRVAKDLAQKESQSKIEWLRELHKWQKSLKDPAEFKQMLKLDFFSDRIFVFTPKGDVIGLPAHATIVDFAYEIHSEVGDACMGGRVNSQVRPIDTELANGDIVDVIVSKSQGKPKRDWLKFVKTQKARSVIKSRLNLN